MSKNTVIQFFDKLWLDYITISPSTKEIHDLFLKHEPNVFNDHVAFRTFSHSKVNISQFEKHLLDMGYEKKGEYNFEAKKLKANHYESIIDNSLPKVFVSELLYNQLSKTSQRIIESLLANVSENYSDKSDFMFSGRPWNTTKKEYDTLLLESEYAAWLSAFGFHANHFTVYVNALSKLNTISQVNELLESNGFELNSNGGKIKGSPTVFLEQSSTKAKNVSVEFSDGSFSIPGCYYEFAKRYPLPNNQMYQGFVATSADKIFESTDVN